MPQNYWRKHPIQKSSPITNKQYKRLPEKKNKNKHGNSLSLSFLTSIVEKRQKLKNKVSSEIYSYPTFKIYPAVVSIGNTCPALASSATSEPVSKRNYAINVCKD